MSIFFIEPRLATLFQFKILDIAFPNSKGFSLFEDFSQSNFVFYELAGS